MESTLGRGQGLYRDRRRYRADEPTPPCGACRQLLWEFCGDIPVYMVSTKGKNDTMKMSQLFPRAFDKSDL